jgi:hypothetical protein
MSNSIRPDQLGEALAEQLTIYHENVVERVDAAGEKAVKALVKRTKATAPERTGRLKKDLTWTALQSKLGTKTFVLHAKAPSHRVLHLVVHGHATSTGGRAKGNPFVQDALDAVLPEYEKDIEEALQGD